MALGLLAKLSSPIYIAAPLAGCLLLAYRDRQAPGDARPPLHRDHAVVWAALGSLVAVAGAVSWYRVNLDRALDHARLASADTGLYGTDQGFARQLPEWIERLSDVAFLPYVWLPIALLAAISLCIAWRSGRRVGYLDPRVVAVAACIMTIAAVLGAFATQPNQEMRYLLGLVPFVALPAALAIAAARIRTLFAAAVVVLAAEFTVVTLQGFGHLREASLVSYPVKELTTGAGFANTLERAVADTCGTVSTGRINMVGVDYAWLNHNVLSMIALEQHANEGLACYYTALGYAANDPNVAWKRVLDFKPPYYVSIDYGNPANPLPPDKKALVIPSDPFNAVNLAVYRRVRDSGLFEVLPGSRRDGLVVFRARPTQ